MIQSDDAINEIIALIFNSSARTSITGAIGTDRPENSDKEDITVNGLTLTFTQLQRVVMNVNLHISNLKTTEAGVTHYRFYNRPRFLALSPIVHAALHGKTTGKIYTEVLSSQLFKEEKSSYMNFRIEVKAKNL